MIRPFVFSTFLVLFAFPGHCQEKNFLDRPYIEVTGTAEMNIVPDQIYIAVNLNEADSKGKVSLENQEQSMLRRLKDLGIDLEKDIRITDVSGSLSSYLIKRDQVERTKSFEVKVSNAEMVGKVFQALAAVSISDAYVERSDHSEMHKFRREVKLEALKIARTKAEDYAKAISQTLGKALFIKELNSYGRAPILPAQTNRSYLVVPEGDGIGYELITLTFSIEAKFELL